MILYHAGFEIIRKPDIYHGRRNADFGQGFYLSDQEAFAHRWAKKRKGSKTIVNRYALDFSDLAVYRFERSAEWFQYIYDNRNGRVDRIDADVIIGPIANDTIYDTFGIITSGFLSQREALRLLMIGPAYLQIVLKSEKAVQNLAWLDANVLSDEEIAVNRKKTEIEEEEYQKRFAEELSKM